jgi:long-chain fatty acid transport protein
MAKSFTRTIALATLIIAGELALNTASVLASPLLDLVGDTGATGGLQARTVAGGSAAAYFNPALLTDAPASANIGFMILNYDIGISLQGRPGTEFAVPDGIANAGHADGSRFENYPIATNLLQFGRTLDARHAAFLARPRQGAGSGHETKTYDVFGLVVKLFDEHVALGLHGLIPNGGFTRLRAFFNDEREQYFSNSLHPELYSDRMTAVSLGLGVGVKLTKNLSLGVGATLGLKANVVASTYVVDTGDLSKILIDMDARVNVGVTPHVGIAYKPSDRLSLTATAHAPQRVELGTQFTFLLASGVEQSSSVTLVLDYTPWQVGVGATYDLLKESARKLSLAGTLLYARWSDYVDRHGFVPSPAYSWSDTISPVLGMRYRLQDFTTFADLGYAPTPVPKQTGRTNYVDNDRLSLSFGGEYGWRLLGTDMKVGAGLQLHRLLPRYQTKLRTPTRADGKNLAPERVKDEVPDDAQLAGEPLASAEGLQTNNPGWPGFGSTGWIVGATLYLSAAF